MNKSHVAKVFNSAKRVTVKHSPEILLGLGIAGMVTTTVLSVRATPKAMALIEEEKLRRYHKFDDDTLTKLDVVKVAWKPYIPAAITGVASISCLIGSSSVNARRMTALTAAYQLSETALSEYREKIVETIGEKKEKAVRDKVNKDKVDKNPTSKSEVIITSKGSTLCFDPISGRYFKSDIDAIKRAENTLNKRMLHDIGGYISLNEFYDEIGLDHIDIGNDLGWNVDELIDITITSHVTDTGEPAIVLDYLAHPKYNYMWK